MTARDAALSALIACRRDGAWADGALKERLTALDRREAALASRLCYGVLQNARLLDFWIDSFCRGKLQPVVREILRLAVYQLRFMDKIPPSAAVNEAVKQTRRLANQQATRLVNGVLRAMLRTPQWPEPTELAVRYSHPDALAALLTGEFGAQKAQMLMASHNTAPATTLQVNRLRATPAQVAAALDAAGAQWEPHPWLSGCLTVAGTGNLEQLAAFRDGWFYVQDAAARLAVEAAALRPGMHVLDCCAAPGGKSFAAAIAMENEGSLCACDIHPHKLKLIEAGAQRLGIGILTTRLQDAAQRVGAWCGAMDAVLVDVPCSGLGVIRKKPDIRSRELAPLEALPTLQLQILENQAQYVRSGGVLIYSTCTILRRENQAVVEAFLSRHPEFVPEAVDFPPDSGISCGAMTTLLPCDHGTDGFFISKLRRQA